jgi:hypothetical protein
MRRHFQYSEDYSEDYSKDSCSYAAVQFSMVKTVGWSYGAP